MTATYRSRRRLLLGALVLVILAAAAVLGADSAPSSKAEKEKPAARPKHEVIACYFHRTVRCPTCKRISAYIEEAVKAGYAKETADGRVSVRMIDFQDPKNQKYTDSYKITGPALILMDVRDGKVIGWKPAPKVWSLVARKDDFFKYVQQEVRSYLEGK